MKKDGLNIRNKIYNIQARADAFPKLPIVEIAGDCRVLIENHLGITQYNNNEIDVKVNFGSVCISGDSLFIAHMTKCKVVICGDIHSVSISKGDYIEDK